MPAKKFAISIPEQVMREVDCAAAARGITRSRFIAQLLERAARARSDAEITAQLDRVFSDERNAAEQRSVARAYRSAASRRGAEW